MRLERGLLLADGRTACVFSEARCPSVVVLDASGASFCYADHTGASVRALSLCALSVLRDRVAAALRLRNERRRPRAGVDPAPYTPANLFGAAHVSAGAPLPRVLRWPARWDDAHCEADAAGAVHVRTLDRLHCVSILPHGQRVRVTTLSPLRELDGASVDVDADAGARRVFRYARVQRECAVDEVPAHFMHAFALAACRKFDDEANGGGAAVEASMASSCAAPADSVVGAPPLAWRLQGTPGDVSDAISVASASTRADTGAGAGGRCSYVTSTLPESHADFGAGDMAWPEDGQSWELEVFGLLRLASPASSADSLTALRPSAAGSTALKLRSLAGDAVHFAAAQAPIADRDAAADPAVDAPVPAGLDVRVDVTPFAALSLHERGSSVRVEAQVGDGALLVVLHDGFVHVQDGTTASGEVRLYKASALPPTQRFMAGVDARALLPAVVKHAQRLQEAHEGLRVDGDGSDSGALAEAAEAPSGGSGGGGARGGVVADPEAARAVVERADVAGVASFTLYGNGRVRARFVDGTLVAVTAPQPGASDRCELFLGTGEVIQLRGLTPAEMSTASRARFRGYVLPTMEFREWGSMTPAERAAAAAHRETVQLAVQHAQDDVRRLLAVEALSEGASATWAASASGATPRQASSMGDVSASLSTSSAGGLAPRDKASALSAIADESLRALDALLEED